MNFKKYHVSKNLFDYKTAYSSYLQPDGTLDGTASQIYSVVNYFDSSLVGKEITISIKATDVLQSRVYILAKINGVSLESNGIFANNTGYMNITLTPSSTSDYWRVSYGNGGTLETNFTEFMLNTGSTALPYEPYSSEVWHDIPYYIHKTDTDTLSLPATIYADGNNATATIYGNLVQSSQPSAVVVNIYPPIDDNSINRGSWATWYDYDRYLPDEPAYSRASQWNGLGNEVYVGVGTWTFSVYIKAEYQLNDAVSIYLTERPDYPHYSESATMSPTGLAIQTVTQAYQRYSVTFEVTEAGYVCPRVEKREDSGTNIIVTCYQLERGSTATPYIAYGKSVISPIYPSETGDRTENLWDEEYPNISGTIRYIPLYVGEGSFTLSTTTPYDSQVANVFLLSGNVSTGASTVGNGAWKNHNVTAQSDSGYITIAYRHYTNTTSPAECKTMLNTGSTAKSYEPYGYKLPVQCGGVTTPVYTAEPLRKIGDYTDYKSNSAEYRIIATKIYDGTETSWHTANGFMYDDDIQPDYLRATGITLVCSHYKSINNVSGGSEVGDGECGFYRLSGVQRLYIRDNNYTTVATFKQYLAAQYAAGTPVAVWYVLATPTTESIEAPEIPTTAGSQTFDVDTTLKPSKVELTYNGWHSHNPKEYSGGSWN